jgi:hypothetical protein
LRIKHIPKIKWKMAIVTKENLRSKARARIHETPEEAHERREANLRNVSDLSRRLIILWMK